MPAYLPSQKVAVHQKNQDRQIRSLRVHLRWALKVHKVSPLLCEAAEFSQRDKSTLLRSSCGG